MIIATRLERAAVYTVRSLLIYLLQEKEIGYARPFKQHSHGLLAPGFAIPVGS
jgi:hypothetical protein